MNDSSSFNRVMKVDGASLLAPISLLEICLKSLRFFEYCAVFRVNCENISENTYLMFIMF
jgi:hypothetical protein